MTRRTVNPHRRFVAVGVVAPVVVAVLAAAAQAALLPSLPATVAIHWGATGRADGFGPAWTFPVLTLIVGVGLPVLFGGAILAGQRAVAGGRPGVAGGQMRFLGALTLGSVVFLTVLATGLVIVQALGSPDAPPLGPPLLSGLAAGVAAGVVGWFAQPPADPAPPAADRVAPLPLSATEAAVWTRVTTTAPAAAVVLVGAALLVVGLGWWFLATQAGAGGAITLAAGVILLLLLPTALAFRVVVDDAGLRVRALAGVPRWHIPLDDVRAVEVVDVNPGADFGGWGWRWAPGRFGVVTRAGEAIQVTRTDGRLFVVTVDDAGTGARLLEAVRTRREGQPAARED